MILLPDDPTIACIERTGYPSWMSDSYEEEEETEPVTVWLGDADYLIEFLDFECKEEAIAFCEEHHWEWVDDNGFCWELVIDD